MEPREYKPNNINSNDEFNYPTEEELYNRRLNTSKNQSLNNKNSYDDYENFLDDNIDENISINMPHNYNSLNYNMHINNPNNINRITFDNSQNNHNGLNSRINQNNIHNIYNYNINNNTNSNIKNINNLNNNNRIESYLDANGNIIYKNNSNEPKLLKLDSHRIKVGKNEFEDLTNEAREIQNKEAFEKKILGIYKNGKEEIKIEQKPFIERIGDFIENHEEGILAIIDGIGCILLHAPSICRTINRFDRWIDNIGNSGQNSNQNEPNNIINEVGLQNKENDLNTILKFLPIWEVRENKRHDNNNNCVVCLYEFKIGDIISALPCCHVFHSECIQNWFRNELTCPVCKFQVTLSSIIGRHYA